MIPSFLSLTGLSSAWAAQHRRRDTARGRHASVVRPLVPAMP
jgi:hypothetical protein